MSATCNYICERYKFKYNGGSRVYAEGGKRCNVCEIFLNVEGNTCPCCHVKLQLKPRTTKGKEGLKRLLAQRYANERTPMPIIAQ